MESAPKGQPSFVRGHSLNGHFQGHSGYCDPMTKDTNSYLLLSKILPETITEWFEPADPLQDMLFRK